MGRRPRIDRAAILDAALALGDEGGVAAITLHGVARRLGVTPMAMYRHVANKADLLDGVLERLLAETAIPPVTDGWEEQLFAMGLSLRAAARRHPAIFPLVLMRPANTLRAREVRERVVAALRRAGVASRDLVHVERLVSTLALGFAVGEAAGRFPRQRDATFRALRRFVVAGLEPFRSRARRR